MLYQKISHLPHSAFVRLHLEVFSNFKIGIPQMSKLEIFNQIVSDGELL